MTTGQVRPDDASPGSASVAGRVIVVTGSGQGIGEGIVRHLAGRGATVVVAEWKAHRVERVVSALRDRGASVLGVVCDITDRQQLTGLVDQTVDRFGRLDGLVNNAHTFTPRSPLIELDAADVATNQATVQGTLWAMQAVHPVMKEAGWGRIVNFVSAAGMAGMAGYGAYNAAKEGMRALTRTAAREWGGDGIVVNAVAPGAASRRGRQAAERDDAEHRAFLRDHPMGRQGDPEVDIAPVVAFLCSDACRFLTGQTLMVDGGAFLWA